MSQYEFSEAQRLLNKPYTEIQAAVSERTVPKNVREMVMQVWDQRPDPTINRLVAMGIPYYVRP